MGLFDSENPIIHSLNADDSEALGQTWNVIRAKIKESSGLQPRLISAPMVRVSGYGDPSDFDHRFVVQWKTDALTEQTMDALEDLVTYLHKPNLTQGRWDPLERRRTPRKYTTLSGGKSEKSYGYLLKVWGVERLASTGIWVTRDFPDKRAAKRALKRERGWLYHGKASVEIRECDGFRQLDFAEEIVQTAHVLAHARPLPEHRLLYELYRGLSRIGMREKTEQDIAGLEEITDFMKWTLFAACKNERAAEYFHCRPESVLLAGVKGTGKTLIAEMLAGKEYNALFVPISAIQLTQEKYQSKGEDDEQEEEATLFSAVQELQERTNARVCLHCDDIEAALLSPEGMETEAHLATNSTLLNKLSGIKQSKNTTLSGSTNDPYLIDERFLRFGRIGYCLHVPLPDEHARDAILAIHTRGMPIGQDVALAGIAQKTEGFTPAALAEICNRAGLYALQRCAERQAAGKDRFEALASLRPQDWEGERVLRSDFEHAYALVSKYASPQQNLEANERIRKFCDAYNGSSLGFKKT